MEPINKRGFTDPVKIEAEAKAIERATAHTDEVLAEYAARSDTHGGRYVCADTFKELMPGFGQSPASRNALNGAVHNSAAVLSSEQFRRMVDRGPPPDQDKVVFVTGIPGAGKSSSVASAVADRAAVVFEGQMSRPEPAMQKIDHALEKGFKVEIVAVHLAPETALDRTNYRFNDPNNGRGASLSVMSEIQGNLPAGLRQIQERYYGKDVDLTVLDNTPGQRKSHQGWGATLVLEKEGNRERIHERLTAALEAGYRDGRYSADFYAQAAGRPAPSMEAGVGQGAGRSGQQDGDRPGIPQADSKRDPLNKQMADSFAKDAGEAVKQYPELAGAAAAVAAMDKQVEAHGLDNGQRAKIMATVRQNVVNSIERGELPEVKVREQVEVEQKHESDRERGR